MPRARDRNGCEPIPKGFPEFISRLNGNSSQSSCVVAITCESMASGWLATVMLTGPLVPWMRMSSSPLVLWPSTGGTTCSI